MTAPVLSTGNRHRGETESGDSTGVPGRQHVLGSWVVGFFCLALLAGPAYDTSRTYDFSHQTDSISYMKMAESNYDVRVTHKYRAVVPWLAQASSMAIRTAYGAVWPRRDIAQHHLRFGFLLVNLGFMSLLGVVLFRTCQAYGCGLAASGLAVVSILTTRTAHYLTALPLVDSFHLLCVALVFLALKTDHRRLLALGILLGPLSKESFVFIVPITLLFGNLRVWVQLTLYAIAALVVLALHYFIDLTFPPAGTGSVQNALNHLHRIPWSLTRLASPGGLGDVFSVLGLFNFVWMFALLLPTRRQLLKTIDLPLWTLLVSVTFQALISTSLSRMLFVAAPLWAVLLGQGFHLGQEWWTEGRQGRIRAASKSDPSVRLAA